MMSCSFRFVKIHLHKELQLQVPHLIPILSILQHPVPTCTSLDCKQKFKHTKGPIFFQQCVGKIQANNPCLRVQLGQAKLHELKFWDHKTFAWASPVPPILPLSPAKIPRFPPVPAVPAPPRWRTIPRLSSSSSSSSSSS